MHVEVLRILRARLIYEPFHLLSLRAKASFRCLSDFTNLSKNFDASQRAQVAVGYMRLGYCRLNAVGVVQLETGQHGAFSHTGVGWTGEHRLASAGHAREQECHAEDRAWDEQHWEHQ